MKYKLIYSTFWGDEKVTKLSADEKLLLLYFFTSPHSNMVGAYRAPIPYILADISPNGNKTAQELAQEITALEQKGFIYYDFEIGFVVVRNYLKHNPLANQNMVKGAISFFNELPRTPILEETARQLNEAAEKFNIKAPFETVSKPLRDGYETPPKPLRNPFGIREQRTETNMLCSIEHNIVSQPKNFGNETSCDSTSEIATPTPTAETIQKRRNDAKEALAYLNKTTGKNYKPIDSQLKFLIGRLKEGYTLDDLKRVIDTMSKEKYFIENPKYMRPETLFGATKFQTYINHSPPAEQKGGAKHTGFTPEYYQQDRQNGDKT
jgi:uncharacterized phage protein (TIGR02220 family)